MSSIARRIASLGIYDPDVTAWVLAVRTAGASVSVARARQVSTLVNALKAANIWNSLDRLWLHAAENSTQALIDLKARATATAVNSPTFTTDRGYTGNGTTSYVNSNFNPSSGTWNMVRDNGSYGGWVVTGPSTTGGFEWSNDFANYGMLSVRYDGTNRRMQVNAGTDVLGPAHGGVYTGFFHGQRTGASAEAFFRNGVSETTKTNVSAAIANKAFGILCYSNGLSNFSTSQVGATFMGAGLAGLEAAFYTPMRTYMTAVGVS